MRQFRDTRPSTALQPRISVRADLQPMSAARHKVKFLPTPCGGPPCAAFVKVRREQEMKGDSALPSAANPPSQNPVKTAWKFFAENLLWVGTGPNYGLVSVNVSPGKFQVLYESVMNFKNQEVPMRHFMS